MTSEPTTAFVWIWLPHAVDPVVCGRLDLVGNRHVFRYARSYLVRPDAVPVFAPELPLQPGAIEPGPGLDAPGVVLDAGPDSWGRRVIESRRAGSAREATTLELLLESGSDRTGHLDFQASPEEYVHRGGTPTLEELIRAAETVESGRALPAGLESALLHGTSIGGARPKAALVDGERSLIAKFSSRSDVLPVVQAEAVAMQLARECGLDVAPVEVVECLGRKVLIVERFDRPGQGRRIGVVSALTILGLPAHAARHCTYHELADAVRAQFDHPDAALRELFARIVFNVAVSNTDDHARNHAALITPNGLGLAPAYDLCPQARTGGLAKQAMAIGRDGSRWSQFSCCVDAAAVFHLSRSGADEIVERTVAVIRERWDEVSVGVGLTEAERDRLWGRQILNPYAFGREVT